MRKVACAIFAVTVLLVGPCAVNTFIPLFLEDVEIDSQFVERCQKAAQSGENRVRDPLALSKEMLGWDNLAEGSGIREYSIRHPSPSRAILVVVHGAADDSIHLYYHHIELSRAASGWIPVTHRRAWQGRGHIGWMTGSGI